MNFLHNCVIVFINYFDSNLLNNESFFKARLKTACEAASGSKNSADVDELKAAISEGKENKADTKKAEVIRLFFFPSNLLLRISELSVDTLILGTFIW